MYVQKAVVKLSVVNGGRKEVSSHSGPGIFLVRGMAGQSVRMGTATAITPHFTRLLKKNEMIRVLHANMLSPPLRDLYAFTEHPNRGGF